MLKLELYWRGVPRGIALFDEPPRVPGEWQLAGIMRIDGGYELLAPDGRRARVRHGDGNRLRLGDFTLVAASVLEKPPPVRTRARDLPWLFIGLLSAVAIAFAVFAWFAPDAPAAEARLDPEWLRRVRFVSWGRDRRVEWPRPRPRRHCPCGGCIVPAGCERVVCHGRWPPPLPNLPRLLRLPPPAFRLIGRRTTGAVVPARPHLSSAGVDRDALAKVVSAHLFEVSACYERAMLRSGPFAGKMVVEWTIDEAGRAHGSRMKMTTVKNDDFSVCVLAHLERWKFPPAHGSVVVTYPFLLNNAGY
jgi:hypothetical protein